MKDEKKLLAVLRTKLAEKGENKFHVVYQPHRGHDHDYAVYVGKRPDDESVYAVSELSPDAIGLGDTLVEALQDAIDTVKHWPVPNSDDEFPGDTYSAIYEMEDGHKFWRTILAGDLIEARIQAKGEAAESVQFEPEIAKPKVLNVDFFSEGAGDFGKHRGWPWDTYAGSVGKIDD